MEYNNIKHGTTVLYVINMQLHITRRYQTKPVTRCGATGSALVLLRYNQVGNNNWKINFQVIIIRISQIETFC